MTELKSCPFCGSDDLRKSNNFYFCKKEKQVKEMVTFVQCNNCGADGPTIAYVEDTVKAWNERKG
jgi:Lar family restriction alleviation protein